MAIAGGGSYHSLLVQLWLSLRMPFTMFHSTLFAQLPARSASLQQGVHILQAAVAARSANKFVVPLWWLAALGMSSASWGVSSSAAEGVALLSPLSGAVTWPYSFFPPGL